MENKKKHISELLAHNFILDDVVRAQIIVTLDTLSEDQLNQLDLLLMGADQKQDEMLASVLKENPNFGADLRGIVRKEVAIDLRAREATSHQKESDELSQIEAEIAAITPHKK